MILCTSFCLPWVVWSAVCIHWSVSWFKVKPTDSNECWVQPSVFSVRRVTLAYPNSWLFLSGFLRCVSDISLSIQPLRIHVIIDDIDGRAVRNYGLGNGGSSWKSSRVPLWPHRQCLHTGRCKKRRAWFFLCVLNWEILVPFKVNWHRLCFRLSDNNSLHILSICCLLGMVQSTIYIIVSQTLIR